MLARASRIGNLTSSILWPARLTHPKPCRVFPSYIGESLPATNFTSSFTFVETSLFGAASIELPPDVGETFYFTASCVCSHQTLVRVSRLGKPCLFFLRPARLTHSMHVLPSNAGESLPATQLNFPSTPREVYPFDAASRKLPSDFCKEMSHSYPNVPFPSYGLQC